MERNLLLKIQYDGSAYHGWQVQENARSVQGVFQEALKQVLHTQPDIKACSRTDTGVHAREFCLSMKLSHNIPPERLLGALNHFCRRTLLCFPAKKCRSIFTHGTPAVENGMCMKSGTTPFAARFCTGARCTTITILMKTS